MKNLFLSRLVLILLFGIFLSACKSGKTTESKYVGDWHYTFEMEGTEYAAFMTINKVEDGYSGSLTSDLGTVQLNDVLIEDDKLTATFDIQGYEINLEGVFDGETFKGKTFAGDYEFPMEAIRKKE